MPQLITMLIAAYKFVKEKVEPKTKIEKIRSLASWLFPPKAIINFGSATDYWT